LLLYKHRRDNFDGHIFSQSFQVEVKSQIAEHNKKKSVSYWNSALLYLSAMYTATAAVGETDTIYIATLTTTARSWDFDG
jgi:hypothetical protein